MAGFAKFWPMPPKSCLATAMAKKLPIIATHSGTVAGRFMASNRPVTTALRSPMVCSRFIARRQRYSMSTQEPTQTAATSSARHPKITMETTSAGQRAMITSSMIFRVVLPLRMWGEGDTM